nr:uncharacterized protein LOC122271306 [Parasteatoda tepidariorum]
MLRIHNALIRSKLDYAATVYGSARKSVLRYLDTIHHQGLRIATGAFRTSPISSLYALYNEPSLSSRRNKLSLNFYFHIKCHPSHPLYSHVLTPSCSTHFSNRPALIPTFGLRMKKLLTDLYLEDFNVLEIAELIPSWNNIKVKIFDIFEGLTKDETSPVIYQQIFYAFLQHFNDFRTIYTDGSKFDNHAASAVVCDSEVISEKLHSAFSVFSSECNAILLALQFISRQLYKKWLIFSDSKSCIDALKNLDNKPHSIIHHIINTYLSLSNNSFEIIFVWIPGHVGIPGNEKADSIAKSTHNLSNKSLSLYDVQNLIADSLTQQRQVDWDGELNNKLHEIKPLLKPFTPCYQNRKSQVLINRLRIGHTRLTHKHLILNETAPTCNFCLEPLTMKLFLTQCLKFKLKRSQYFNCYFPTLLYLLGDPPHPNLMLYLKDIGFYNLI